MIDLWLGSSPGILFIPNNIGSKKGRSLKQVSILNIFQANGGIERAVLDAYCWMYSSWNIPQEYKGACTGGDQVSLVPVINNFINMMFYLRCITAYVQKIHINYKITVHFCKLKVCDTELLRALSQAIMRQTNKLRDKYCTLAFYYPNNKFLCESFFGKYCFYMIK